MRDSTSTLRELEAWVQGEVAAKDRLRSLVEAQIGAVEARSPSALEAATAAVSSELASSADRDERRVKLFRALAAHHGLDAGTLTLGDVLARVGSDGAMLSILRIELRRATSDLLRSVRRMSALARLHRELVRDAIATVAGRDVFANGGALVDREA